MATTAHATNTHFDDPRNNESPTISPTPLRGDYKLLKIDQEGRTATTFNTTHAPTAAVVEGLLYERHDEQWLGILKIDLELRTTH